MDKEKFDEIAEVSVAGGTPPTAEQVADVLTAEELLAAANRRGLSVGEAAQETAPNALSMLSPERQERARALQTAMAEHFSTEERPLSPEDFEVVIVSGDGDETETDGETEPKACVMLTTGKGLYGGSYNTIMSDDQKYIIEVDGQKIDTRKAMTWETYQAFIEQEAKANGTDSLPDSCQLANQNGQPWAGTWFTGEEEGGSRARCGFVLAGKPRRYWNNRNRDWRHVLVRPTVEV